MASGGSGGLKEAFDKYSRFGKTEAQLKEKEPRIESKNVQKMMKDGGILNTKYTTQLLDNDVARVLGKLTIGGTYPKGTWVLHFRGKRRGNECFLYSSKTFELQGFKLLIDQVADSKKTTADDIIARITSTGGPSLANVTVNRLWNQS